MATDGLDLILVDNVPNPCIVVNESMSVPLGDFMSSGNYDLHLALKSPDIIKGGFI